MRLNLINKLNLPNDTGPIYQETIMGRLPVEPFNTLSNLVFLMIIIYFSTRVYKKPKQHLFLALSLPILTIGFIGGTMFHGTRSHQIWLFMDWIPIMILCMSAVVYFIFKLYKSWRKRIVAFLLNFWYILWSAFTADFCEYHNIVGICDYCNHRTSSDHTIFD